MIKTSPSHAKTGLEYCNRLFALERSFKDLTAKERYEQRLEKSKPLLDEFHGWLKKIATTGSVQKCIWSGNYILREPMGMLNGLPYGWSTGDR